MKDPLLQSRGMRRNEKKLTGRLARPVTLQTVLIKAKLAGMGTEDARKGEPARIHAPGGVEVQLTEFPGEYVFADVLKPEFGQQRLRLRTIPDVQQFIKDLGKSTAAPVGGSTAKKEGNRP